MAENSNYYWPHEIINGKNWSFVEPGVKEIIKSNAFLSAPGATVNVVSVVGAQNSGKSTLANSLFGCHFEVMDLDQGFQQTTEGLWVSACTIPNLLVVDVEGFDRENQKESMSFEGKSALFALTISDVMILNMWAWHFARHYIYGGSFSLLQTIFKERVKLGEGQTRLLVVLRAYDGEIKFEKLRAKVESSMEKAWNMVNNLSGRENIVPFKSYIDVKVVTLADKILDSKKFEAEVAELKEWFKTEAFVGLEQHKVTATDQFVFSAMNLWEQIMLNKQLDLPTHMEMVNGHFCDKAKKQCLASLDSYEDYLSLQKETIHSAKDFIEKVESILQYLTDRYDEETKTYEKEVKNKRREELIDNIITLTTAYCQQFISRLGGQMYIECVDHMTTDPSNADDLVKTCMKEFSCICEVLSSRYPSLFTEDRIREFERHLDKHSKMVQLDNLKLQYEQRLRSNFTLERSNFTLEDLKQATQNFNESLILGRGAYGRVYKGYLHGIYVAIKILNPECMHGVSGFKQEVAILTTFRHPNLLTLIGVCYESSALVYEFLSNGSLEDYLKGVNNTRPLTWQVRTRIMCEICVALSFLHSNKPNIVIHGDLKPDNVLLDANFTSKLGDFGISRIIERSNTKTTLHYSTRVPVGTYQYMDPQFVLTGKLTEKSDVFAFGVIILRLLTGKSAPGFVVEVEEAIEDGTLDKMIDVSAGEWPFDQAKQLAKLGLWCAEIKRVDRPNLSNEVWPILERLRPNV